MKETLNDSISMNEQRESRNSQQGEIMPSPKRLARIAGVFYLIVGIFCSNVPAFGRTTWIHERTTRTYMRSKKEYC
jgi:hypothetical protein